MSVLVFVWSRGYFIKVTEANSLCPGTWDEQQLCHGAGPGPGQAVRDGKDSELWHQRRGSASWVSVVGSLSLCMCICLSLLILIYLLVVCTSVHTCRDQRTT